MDRKIVDNQPIAGILLCTLIFLDKVRLEKC